MKQLNLHTCVAGITLLCVLLMLACATNNGNNMNEHPSDPKQFATSQEAVAKGKSDLLEILKTDDNNSLGINAQQLEKAQSQEAVTWLEIDMKKFISTDSLSSLRDVIIGERGKINPLYADNALVTTIQTRFDNNGWSVSGIKDPLIEAEISELRNTSELYKNSEVALYEIPNIDAHIYSIRADGQEFYYTNYKGMSLAKPADIREVLTLLRADALEFEKEYGGMIRKQKLVK